MIKSAGKKSKQFLYEYCFLAALEDCFPNKKESAIRKKTLYLYALENGDSAIGKAKEECWEWIDRMFLGKVPESILKNKASFAAVYEEKNQRHKIIVRVGSNKIIFYVIPPDRKKDLIIWHKTVLEKKKI